MNKYAIVVKDLVKKYGDLVAVAGINFNVKYGEIFGFLGPNGAGKTTTIHILATLLKPTSGKALVAGYDVIRDPKMVRKNIGIVFQDPSLDNNLTAYENMYIHGRIYGLHGEELRTRIEEMLEFVELYEYRNKLVKTFSGGMRRRLEIARALLHLPKILFLDEPTLGLDPQTRVRIWDYIRELRKEKNITIFLTTHYMDEAEELCDRIAIIDHGKIIAEGTPDQLKSIVGNDVIYLKISEKDMNEICSKLEGSFIKKCKPLRKDMVALNVDNAPQALPLIFDKARANGLKILEVSYRKPTLNDVFIYLTGRELRDSTHDSMEFAKMIIKRRLMR